MLALRISFMNDIANLCEKCGANVDHVRLGVGLDSRIGKRFLFPGIGYGGSCFPKDVKALIDIGRKHDAPQRLLEVTHDINEAQKRTMVPRILQHFGGDIKGRHFAMWGLAFKPKYRRHSRGARAHPHQQLLEHGATVCAYDPEAMEAVRRVIGDRIEYSQRHYEACDGADALIIVTEWNKFREPDFNYMRELLKQPVIFDGRTCTNSIRCRVTASLTSRLAAPACSRSARVRKMRPHFAVVGLRGRSRAMRAYRVLAASPERSGLAGSSCHDRSRR
jgi:UDPglucose 6-dehydrogenase